MADTETKKEPRVNQTTKAVLIACALNFVILAVGYAVIKPANPHTHMGTALHEDCGTCMTKLVNTIDQRVVKVLTPPEKKPAAKKQRIAGPTKPPEAAK